MDLTDKIGIVKKILKDKKVAIGFSGGADSTLIAYLSSKVAQDTLAITIDNHLFPTGFLRHAKKMSQYFNIRHEVIDIDFYEDGDFLKNDSRRCFTCRNLMYSKIRKLAEEEGFDFICDGNNISDLISDRPGILVTYEKGFRTPLIDARLTSREIHEYLDKNKIPYSRSTTCLATRIRTNTPTSPERISKIRRCEDYITDCTGCEIVKVRDFGQRCIVEVDSIDEILQSKRHIEINDELKRQGFEKVCLNLSEIDDNDDITIDYERGSFKYQLPFTLDIEKTKEHQNRNYSESFKKITIHENGLIEGNGFENHDDALETFMDTLVNIRRNV